MIDLGLMLPYISPTTRETTLAWIERGEEGPFKSLSVGERVAWESLDQFVMLSAAAALTERVKISLQITIVPMHPAALNAKRIASLDLISGGRVRVGVGIGDRPEDYFAADRDMDRRYGRLAEGVAEMRRLWSGEPLGDGMAALGPKPVQPGGPEVWTGGWGPKGLAKAAKWADGYMGYTADGATEELEGTAATVRGAWEAAEREPPPLITSAFFALGEDGGDQLRDRIGTYFGAGGSPTLAPLLDRVCTVCTPEACRTALANAEAAGYEEFTFIPVTDDVAEVDRLRDALGV
jgi:alkanesulfonate monooxygenase SsuD/methylene tetrahydromethanopterin reductase-like flavin-dependent oxidoreductase (luciferase family)